VSVRIALATLVLLGCTTDVRPEADAPEPAARLTQRPDADAWRRRVLYFTVVDRFANGDVGNDQIYGDPDCNDASDPAGYQGGDLAGLRAHLDHIEDLGADALWVTPLYRGVPSRAGSNCGFPGYWIDFADPYQVELDPRYGTEAELDGLVTELHGRGMPLMLDMVVNHAGYDAELVTQRPDWFTDPATCWQQGPPEIYCPLAGLPDFDHRVPEVADYLEDVHVAWVRRFGFDAIRMDTVKHVEPWYFQRWNDRMRAERPELYIVGELLDEYSYDPFQPYLDAGFDGLFNFPLRRGLIETFAHGGSVDHAASRMHETFQRFGDRTGSLVNLLDNHDVPRFLEEIGSGVPAAEAQARYHLALTALLTLPGVPQIYYGNEVGMYGGADPDNRRFMPDWAFDAATRPGTRPGFVEAPDAVYDHIKRLLRIRRLTPALQDGSYVELARQGAPQNNNLWAYLRRDGDSAAVVVHNNGLFATAGAVSLSVGTAFADGTTLHDVLGHAGTFTVQNGSVSVALPGRTSAILRAPPTAPAIDVRFEVLADVGPGEVVHVTGTAAALGGWEVSDALPLTRRNCIGTTCAWTGRVALAEGAPVDWKLVTIDAAQAVRWENGGNRHLVPTPGRPARGRFRP
jgi:glycosidase